MTYAPDDLKRVRIYILALALGLEPNAVGIKGDDKHPDGYHVGNNALALVGRLLSDYSKRESARDRPGTDAASALDIGQFRAVIQGRTVTLLGFTLALVAACRRGDPRTRDIREIIYTPDGKTVRRWDRLGIRTTGDLSHLIHTHISFFRDSEGRRDQLDNFMGLVIEILEGGTSFMAGLPDFKQDDVWEWLALLVDPEMPANGREGDRFHFPSPFRKVVDRLSAIEKAQAELMASVVKLLTGGIDAAALAADIAARVIDADDNTLTDADKPVIVAAVKDALRQGVGSEKQA